MLRGKSANPSPTASRSPLSATGRGLLSVDISLSEQNVQTRGVGQAPYPSPAERDRGPALRDQRGQDARTTAGETPVLPGQASIDPDHLTSPGMALGKRRVMLGLLCPQPSRRKVTNHRPADVVRKRIPTNTAPKSISFRGYAPETPAVLRDGALMSSQ